MVGTTKLSRDEIYQGVRDVLVTALNVDEKEIVERASLIRDFGADSLDNLAIISGIEERFRIKISTVVAIFPGVDFWYNKSYFVSKPGGADNLSVSTDGLEFLKRRYSHINLDNFSGDINEQDILSRITVGALVKYVEGRLSS